MPPLVRLCIIALNLKRIVSAMRIQFVLIMFVAIELAACSSVSPVNPFMQDLSNAASLDVALQDVVDAGVAPGLVVTVVKGDEVVYAGAVGAADGVTRRLPTAASGLNLWSISKVFTQLTVLQLASDSTIDLDAPVCSYTSWLAKNLCESANTDPQRSVRTLLNHSAGIPDVGFALYAQTQYSGDDIPSQRLLANELIPPMKKWSEAGEISNYSNSHYLLLGAIVEEVTGTPLPDVVRDKVLAPLGLLATGYRHNSEDQIMQGSHPVDFTSLLAFRYVEKKRAVQSKLNGRYWFNPVYNAALGSTGMVSTAEDMGRFMGAMLACLREETGSVSRSVCQQIVDSNGLTVGKSPARGVKGLSQKTGWFVLHEETGGVSYSHGGSGMGYTSMLQLFPDRNIGVFVAANDTYFDRAGGLAVASRVAGIDWQTEPSADSPE